MRGGVGTNSFQICLASKAGLEVALAQTADDHPKVTLRFHRRQTAQWHRSKMDLITLTRRITGSFPALGLEMFICTLPTSKYVRNFNTEGRNKKIKSISNDLCALAELKGQLFFFIVCVCETEKEV